MSDLIERLASMDIDGAAECLTAATGLNVEPFEMPANPQDRERCELALRHTSRPIDPIEFLHKAKESRGVLFAVKDESGCLMVHEFNSEVSEAYRQVKLFIAPQLAFQNRPLVN